MGNRGFYCKYVGRQSFRYWVVLITVKSFMEADAGYADTKVGSKKCKGINERLSESQEQ